jgi:uncharacterized protein YciW
MAVGFGTEDLHKVTIAVLIALVVFDLLLLLAGLRQFQKKSVS